MGLGDMHAHGNPIVHTPNLDQFARESVVWGRFYSTPLCAPTRAGWMAGRDSFCTGVVDVFGRAPMQRGVRGAWLKSAAFAPTTEIRRQP